MRLQAPPCERSAALPQGPSLRSGLCCPRPSSLSLVLVGPIRPSCRHISISPQCGLYAMPFAVRMPCLGDPNGF
jgi:hypothetical protein